MAELNYKELEGNGFLMEAARRLTMLREFKEKPFKLNDAQIEYSRVLIRYLVFAYCKAENMPDKAKFELIKQMEPHLIEMKEAVDAGRISRGTLKLELPEHAPEKAPEFPLEEYLRTLNAWHLELSILRDMIAHVLDESVTQDEAGLSACAHIAKDRFEHLVETCPFPSSVTSLN